MSRALPPNEFDMFDAMLAEINAEDGLHRAQQAQQQTQQQYRQQPVNNNDSAVVIENIGLRREFARMQAALQNAERFIAELECRLQVEHVVANVQQRLQEQLEELARDLAAKQSENQQLRAELAERDARIAQLRREPTAASAVSGSGSGLSSGLLVGGMFRNHSSPPPGSSGGLSGASSTGTLAPGSTHDAALNGGTHTPFNLQQQ